MPKPSDSVSLSDLILTGLLPEECMERPDAVQFVWENGFELSMSTPKFLAAICELLCAGCILSKLEQVAQGRGTPEDLVSAVETLAVGLVIFAGLDDSEIQKMLDGTLLRS